MASQSRRELWCRIYLLVRQRADYWLFVNERQKLAWESAGCSFLKQRKGRRDFATQSVVKKHHTALALCDVKQADNVIHTGIAKGVNFRAFQKAHLINLSEKKNTEWKIILKTRTADDILNVLRLPFRTQWAKSKPSGSPPKEFKLSSVKRGRLILTGSLFHQQLRLQCHS